MTGDYLAVNGELKMATAPVNTDASGHATVNFKPALRTSPSDDAPVTIQGPTCLMVLADDQQTLWDADHNGVYQEHTFTAIEVFA